MHTMRRRVTITYWSTPDLLVSMLVAFIAGALFATIVGALALGFF